MGVFVSCIWVVLRRNFHLQENQFLKAIFYAIETEIAGEEFFEFVFPEMLRHIAIAFELRILLANDR